MLEGVATPLGLKAGTPSLIDNSKPWDYSAACQASPFRYEN
jgi:hypothetical protein